jgi:hypothetical protein
MIFGVSHSVLCLFLRYSIRILFKVLKEEPLAKVLRKKFKGTTQLLGITFQLWMEHGVLWMV